MLSVSQPFVGIIEEALSAVLNLNLLRLRNNKERQGRAFVQSSNQVTRIPSGHELSANGETLPALNPVLSNEIELFGERQINCIDVLRPKKSASSLLLRISSDGHTLLLTQSGHLTIHKRGFRSKTYAIKGSSGSGKTSQIISQSILEEKNSMFGFLSSKWKDAWNKTVKDESSFEVMVKALPPKDQERVKAAFAEGFMASKGVLPKKRSGLLWSLIFIGVLIYFGINAGIISTGLRLGNPISNVAPEEVNVTFNDVKGIEEAKDEVMKIVDYLKDPVKYTKLGARLPKGVLLIGLPGAGKTLLAKAIAGEAQVPFFRTSGSEFEEMLVGLGAKRVRDLFAAARGRAPCVIFIDEIDSIGTKRAYSPFHPYANQTINQLLTEMDGFLSSTGIIVLAATNRRKDLDPALTRPGRFDLEISVDLPDLNGRTEIFTHYLSKVKVASDVDAGTLAKSTIGFSGADIENMVNQAALQAAAANMPWVNMSQLEQAHDLISMGPPKKARPPYQDINLNTAYHEAGHALVAYFSKGAYLLHKVTILPRGASMGHTATRPDREIYQQSKAELFSQLDVMMGGRAAEELLHGPENVTTGARSDMASASALAEHLVRRYGMSDNVGLRYFDDNNENLSDSTAESIDREIKRILHESYDRAKAILKNNSPLLKRLAEALLQHETLSYEDVKQLVESS